MVTAERRGARGRGALRILTLVAGLGAFTLAAGVDGQTAAPPKAKPRAAAAAKHPPAAAFRPVVEAGAMALLKASSERLAAAKTMSFTATVGYEYPSKLGPPIVYTVRYDVALQRPDHLRVLIPGDGPASEFYYDGRTMTAFAPAENLAAIAPAPPTVDAMLLAAYEQAATYFPFTDLVATDPFDALSDGVTTAFYVGTANNVGGVPTDIVAWANADVFMQIWIGRDDKLPRRMRAVFSADPLGLRHDMMLSDWKLDPALPAGTFVSALAQAAGRMDFAVPSAPVGARPITAKSKSKPPANPAAKAH
jgi:hypothetical protein